MSNGYPQLSLLALAIALCCVGCASRTGDDFRTRAYGPDVSLVPEIREGQQPELWADLERLIVAEYHRTKAFAEVNAAACGKEPASTECAQRRRPLRIVLHSRPA